MYLFFPGVFSIECTVLKSEVEMLRYHLEGGSQILTDFSDNILIFSKCTFSNLLSEVHASKLKNIFLSLRLILKIHLMIKTYLTP